MIKKLYKYLYILITAILIISFAICQPINANTLIFLKNNSEQIDSTESSVYDLLIITPDEYSLLLKPLVNHKNNMDVKTRLVSVSEVYSQVFLGRDKPEKIKFFIKDAYDNWGIKYVMLVGDFRKMPIRYVYNNEPNWTEPCFISELYYADIYNKNGNFSSWDANDNGVFGEWIGDNAQDSDIDLYPDVYVGRFACRNSFEVKIMVNKVINYETSTYGSDWFKRIVVAAGDTYPDGQYPFPTPEYEGEENMRTVLGYMSGFENTTLFTSDATLEGPDDIIKAVNPGCGFLAFDGHANPALWSTHQPNNREFIPDFNILTISRLWNFQKLPVCVVGGCHNSQFDVHLSRILEEPWYYRTWVPECWSWTLTRKIGGGSIATIGNTGLGMSKEDKSSLSGAGDYLEPQFFYEYGVNGTDILGECWGKAITRYLNAYPINWNTPAGWDYSIDAKTVQQWVLLGDPSLKIGGYPPTL
jgi:hypothetical protein